MLCLAVLFALVCSSFSSRLPYIVGGEDAKVGEFPWQASLQLALMHTCGASLISDRWLVTAGHCVFGTGKLSLAFTVVLGAHDKTTQFKGDPTRHIIKRIIVHPHYDWRKGKVTQPGDIALIELKTPAKLKDKYLANKYIKPIRLADEGEDFSNMQCTISGWGLTKGGSIFSPNTLQKLRVRVTQHSKYRKTHITVYGLNGRSTACNGDSGGPLACYKNGVWKLAGAFSYMSKDCLPGHGSTYTSIPYYRRWIKENTGI